ncbi:MAG: hypothetical protein WHV44_04820 [Anaerolineales bacterium]
MNKRIFKTALLLALALTLAFSTVAFAEETVPLNPAHVGATNPNFGTGTCPTPPAGKEGWWGWHFIMPGNNNFTSLTVTFKNAGTFSANPFPGGVFVAHPDNSHAYIWTPDPDTLLSGSATSDGDNKSFNLSHVCPGTPKDYEKLTVSKTAVTSFTREHFWDISKSVNVSDIYLYIPGQGMGKPSSGTATWTVDVTYEGYTDSDFNVSGDITINNIGTLDAVITSVEDVLAGTPISVDCGVTFPYTLPKGETLTCTYNEDVASKIEGKNKVTVTTERDTYGPAYADIVWGAPTTEINKTVTIEDDSDLFGKVTLGTVTAPTGATFTYTKTFNWADYGADACGDYTYDNTATIVETGQSAAASLSVHVQCYKYETAFAKADSGSRCFLQDGFSRWGWTNQITAAGTYTMPLWAAAGQCDTSKGTLVGSVTVTYTGSAVSYGYNVTTPYMLKETHFYAGKTMYPQVLSGKKLVNTVAPGQYYISSSLSPAPIWVIAHAVVGLPDPSFGP